MVEDDLFAPQVRLGEVLGRLGPDGNTLLVADAMAGRWSAPGEGCGPSTLLISGGFGGGPEFFGAGARCAYRQVNGDGRDDSGALSQLYVVVSLVLTETTSRGVSAASTPPNPAGRRVRRG